MPVEIGGGRLSARDYATGFGWVIGYLVLWIAIEIGSAYAGLLAGHDWRVLSPVIHGVLEIVGVLGLTWLFRVKANGSDLASLGMVPPRWSWLIVGLATGTIGIGIVAGVEYALGWLHPLTMQFGPRSGAPRLLFLIAVFAPSIGVGIVEELAFRGYIFETFAERGPTWVAAWLSAALFAALHLTLGGFGIGFVVTDMLMAIVFLMLRWIGGSLWLPIGAHAAWDYVQTYLIGLSTTGSGASDPALLPIRQTGPALWVGSPPAIEGGLIFLLLMLLILGALALLQRRFSQAGRRR